jgi:hypothetical protein
MSNQVREPLNHISELFGKNVFKIIAISVTKNSLQIIM